MYRDQYALELRFFDGPRPHIYVNLKVISYFICIHAYLNYIFNDVLLHCTA